MKVPSKSLGKVKKSPLLLSYHDITSGNFSTVEEHLQLFPPKIKKKIALMVIPYPEGDIQFKQWLHLKKEQGHEIFCHGWQHKCDPQIPRSIKGIFINKLTSQAAEFAGLSENDSAQVLDSSLKAFSLLNCGEPLGFVPPTWWDCPSLKSQVKERGVFLYETRYCLWNLIDQQKYYSLPLSLFSTNRSTHRLSIFLCQNAMTIKAPFKMALHPVDFKWTGWVSSFIATLNTKNLLGYEEWMSLEKNYL